MLGLLLLFLVFLMVAFATLNKEIALNPRFLAPSAQLPHL